MYQNQIQKRNNLPHQLNQQEVKDVLNSTKDMYCLDCGAVQITARLPEHPRFCIVCLGENLTDIAPPEMTEEQWSHLLKQGGE